MIAFVISYDYTRMDTKMATKSEKKPGACHLPT